MIEVEDINLPQSNKKLSKHQETRDLSKPLIACIDDSPQIGKIPEQIITKYGYRCVSIPESLQAFPSLIKANPDLIFLNIGIPIVNGYEICTQVRRVEKLRHIPIVFSTGSRTLKADLATKTIPVILCSSKSTEADKMWGDVVGADAYIAKPVDRDELINKVQQLITS